MKKSCSVIDCYDPVQGNGYCHKHYYRWRINGDPLVVKLVQKGDWPPGKKWCPHCKSFKVLKDFFDRPGLKSGGKDGYCKVCRKIKNNNFRTNSPEKYMHKQIKARAKKYGLAFEIEIDDIKIPEYCPVLGMKLSMKGDVNNVPSLDRIDNSKGYLKDNVRVISWRANNLKSNAQAWEMELVLKYLKGEI